MNKIIRFAALIIVATVLLELCVSADTQSRNTRGEVDFDAGTGPVNPLDPDSPDTWAQAPDGVITNNPGPLSLNIVPEFIFAQEDGSPLRPNLTGGGTYSLYNPERPYAQISDLRGTGGGWTLTVSAFPLAGENLPELKGARISLINGSAHSSNPALTPFAVQSRIDIECNAETAPALIAQADENDGMGAWIIRWYADDAGVELYIPPETPVIPGSYTAVLLWTLQDTV